MIDQLDWDQSIEYDYFKITRKHIRTHIPPAMTPNQAAGEITTLIDGMITPEWADEHQQDVERIVSKLRDVYYDLCEELNVDTEGWNEY